MLQRRMCINKVLNKLDKQYFPMPDYVQNKYLRLPLEYKGKNLTVVAPFVAKNGYDEYYIDLLIYDDGKVERFIIRKEYCLPPEEEKILLDYSIKCNFIDNEDLYAFGDEVLMVFPEIQFRYYDNLSMMIEHIYFATHNSGVKEILYKSGLNCCARFIHMFEEYNVLGSSPEGILGLSVKCLRIYDNMDMCTELFSANNRKYIKNVYESVSSYIDDNIPNRFQWKYLCSLVDDNGEIKEKYNYNYYKILGDLEEQYIVNYYDKYIKLRQSSKYKRLFPQYPKQSDICDELGKLYVVTRLEKDEKAINERLNYYADYYGFEYETEEHVMIAPRRLSQIFHEAIDQHNCLINYVEMLKKGETSIIFIREKKNIKKSYITIEIKDNRIVGALGKCNRSLENEEIFLIEQYALVKKLIFESDEAIIVDNFLLTDYYHTPNLDSSFDPGCSMDEIILDIEGDYHEEECNEHLYNK